VNQSRINQAVSTIRNQSKVSAPINVNQHRHRADRGVNNDTNRTIPTITTIQSPHRQQHNREHHHQLPTPRTTTNNHNKQ
jgi:hypothetical protein